jgi:hypothetical protein
MARPGQPERNRVARSFGQLRRFHHGTNSDKVLGTHKADGGKDNAQGAEAKIIVGGYQTLSKAELITLEWCPYLLARAGGDPEPALSLVAGFQKGSIVIGERGDPMVWLTGSRGGCADALCAARKRKSSAILRGAS